MLLADIGNTRTHIYNGKSVIHLLHKEVLESYKDKELFYICVSLDMSEKIKDLTNWTNISNTIHIKGEYDTMGIDRKALCLSHKDGIFVDAGSAITVDVVKENEYQGGFILLGINAWLNAYKGISSALGVEINHNCSLAKLPKTTKDSISYGIIASIKAVIETNSFGLPIYFTGGDGEWLSSYFKNSIYDEFLVFKGIQKALKENKC
ncbi:MAG: type III pantothenate kinase [Sulfurovaceae bacterium]|nr:type III pantothenate kinase [Sulfurovaceae bacterium]MDD5548822.1 type III pantothenate kinase [Sulfurovaceae bacterium]